MIISEYLNVGLDDTEWNFSRLDMEGLIHITMTKFNVDDSEEDDSNSNTNR